MLYFFETLSMTKEIDLLIVIRICKNVAGGLNDLVLCAHFDFITFNHIDYNDNGAFLT